MGGIKKHKKHKSDKREKFDGQFFDKPPALKLILKVGSSSTTPEHSNEWPLPNQSTGQTLYSVQGQDEESRQSALSGSYFLPPHHKKSKKKKKKKDKSKDKDRKHRHKDKKRRHDEDFLLDDTLNESVTSNLNREPRLCVLRQRNEKSSLQKLLEHLLKALEKKDQQHFFAWPVSDVIAPGYSQIISKPMDFYTMRQKIDDNSYQNLPEFIADFRLMCSNALEYNHVDTIYYKAGKKLLHAGMKLMQPDKLSWVLVHLPDLTSQELGFEVNHDIKQEMDLEPEDNFDASNNTVPLTKFQAIPDDLTPEEILAQCQAAAKDAKAKLSLKVAEPKMGFLRQKKDGSTSLNILVGGTGCIPGTNERPVSLGVLTGKLAEGTGSLQPFREDRRNTSKPVKPLYYGSFSSYAPSFDSTFANLSKEDSDLVLQTYGSETAVQYADSILDFARDCDYTLRLVDSLLDLLTQGEHSKTKKIIEEKKKLKDEEESIRMILEEKTDRVDIDGLKSLQDLGIDVSFLQTFEDSLKRDTDQLSFSTRLQTTSALLEKLAAVQTERLSLPLPAHLGAVPGASEQELLLAESITTQLAEMSRRVAPGDVVSLAGLRRALGVAPEPEPEPELPDLEQELRQFLDQQASIAHSPLASDKTIEEILME